MPDKNDAVDGEATINSDDEVREAAEVWETAVAAGDTIDEEAFEAAFEEFAAEDDTKPADPPADPPAEGRKDEGQQAAAETKDQPASGEESPDTDEAAPADQPSGDAAEPEDIWGDATPEQKAAFEAAQTEAKTHRNRASAQNRKIAELMSAPKPAAEVAAEPPATPETDEVWEKFATEYPEVAGPMADRMGRQDKQIADLLSKNADLRGQVTGITDAQTQVEINAEEALLVQRHPDWKALSTNAKFNTWLPQQPRYVQEGFARNGEEILDGAEAADLIDLFNASQPPAKQPGSQAEPKDTSTNGKVTRRQRRLESAVQTESGQAGPGAGPPEGDFDAAFDHFAALP